MGQNKHLVFRTSQKNSTASDQYFLSYGKKTTWGGGQIEPPPPAGIGLRVLKFLLKSISTPCESC